MKNKTEDELEGEQNQTPDVSFSNQRPKWGNHYFHKVKKRLKNEQENGFSQIQN